MFCDIYIGASIGRHNNICNVFFCALKEIINVDVLSANFNDGDTVTIDSLKAKKLVPQSAKQVKLLARGTLDKALHVELQDYSIEAVKMIIATGGTVKKA